MLQKLILKLGVGRLAGWVRDAQAGKLGERAKLNAETLVAHAWALGLLAGGGLVVVGLYFGPDSQIVSVFVGTVAPTLVTLGFLPASWQKPVDTLDWHGPLWQLLKASSAELGLLLAGWWKYSIGTCVAAGGFKVLSVVIPCSLSTLACALVFGTFVQLGLVSSTLLAPPPKG